MRADLKRLKRDSSGAELTQAAWLRYPDLIGGEARRRSSDGILVDSATHAERRRRSGAIIVLAVSMLMIGAGLYGLYNRYARWRGDSGPIPFQNMAMEKLTSSGHAVLATISPDGKYVVSAVDEGKGQQSLWMRHVATGSNAQIMAAAEVALLAA